jgi:hypothetical protein
MDADDRRRAVFRAQIEDLRIAIARLDDGRDEFACRDAGVRRPNNALLRTRYEAAIAAMEWAIAVLAERSPRAPDAQHPGEAQLRFVPIAAADADRIVSLIEARARRSNPHLPGGKLS